MKRIAASGRELTVMRSLVSSFEVACEYPNRQRGFGRIEHDIVGHARLVDPNCGSIHSYHPTRRCNAERRHAECVVGRAIGWRWLKEIECGTFARGSCGQQKKKKAAYHEAYHEASPGE